MNKQQNQMIELSGLFCDMAETMWSQAELVRGQRMGLDFAAEELEHHVETNDGTAEEFADFLMEINPSDFGIFGEKRRGFDESIMFCIEKLKAISA